MKLKPKFILYSNKNKTPPQNQKKSENSFDLIFERIPAKILDDSPELRNAKLDKKRKYLKIIKKDEKPSITKIDDKINDKDKKVILKINNFKEMIYDYNKENNHLINNYNRRKKENNLFSNVYNRIQKEKNKFTTGTYLDYKSFLDISNKYISKNIKIPKLSLAHNIFSVNPLILSGKDLENYVAFNMGNKEKAFNYINKLDYIVNRRKEGNFKLSVKEMENLTKIIKLEKPKGYISPEIEIPKLKDDINKSQKFIKNLDEFDIFFEKLKKSNIYSNKYKSKSTGNIFNSINNSSNSNSTDNTNININQRKLSNYFKHKKLLLNNSSIAGNIGIEKSRNPSPIKPSKHFILNNNSNNSLIKDKNMNNIKLPRFITPLNSNSNNKIRNSEIISSNYDYKYFMKDNLYLKRDKLNKKNKIHKFRRLSDYSYHENNKKNNSYLTSESEYDELYELNKQIEKKNILKNTDKKEENDNNILKLKNSPEEDCKVGEKENNENKNNNKEINENEKEMVNKDINNIKEEKKDIENIRYNKIEKLFDIVKQNEFNFEENKKEMESYMLSKGKNFNKLLLDKKSGYLNIKKIKQKVSWNQNLILEEYMIRNGFNIKKPFVKEQQIILDKDKGFIKKIVEQEQKYSEVLCKGKI